MNCVDKNTGEIIASKVPATKNWTRNDGIEQILTSLRSQMASDANRRTKQPPEGSTFWWITCFMICEETRRGDSGEEMIDGEGIYIIAQSWGLGGEK